MEHLSQEELLLLADGELSDDRAAHLDACAACCSAAGSMQGRLTAITAQLRASTPSETPESHSASWARLENAIRGESGVLSAHLLPEELLLHLDDELVPERALHLESCEDCHDDLLRVQALLFDIEHELRALIPAESGERRLAAAAALEQKIYPPKKVISFPVRWGAVYAAAAALTFAVFGGLWTSQQPAPVVNEPVVAQQAPLLVTPPQAVAIDVQPVAPQPTRSAATEAAATELADVADVVEPERFELAAASAASAPPPQSALRVGEPVRIAAPPLQPLTLAWAPPALPAAAVARSAMTAAPAPKPQTYDPDALLAGLRAAVQAGAWMTDVEPLIRDGVLTFSGRVGSARERDELAAAIRRELDGRDVSFDLAVADRSPSLGESAFSYSLGDRPAGGVMRTALLAHYGDAARRSFQQPSQSALDAEIARFAGEIYRSQSRLVRHAHALSGLLGQFGDQELSAEAARSFDSLVRFHAGGIAESEAQIYDHLSETLPRRFWNHRGDREAPADADEAASGQALLSDALRLDETLTTLLGSAARPVDAAEAQTSAGALLYRIRTRARILTSGLDSNR